MSTFWIDDLGELVKLLPEINKRMWIDPNEEYFIEDSAKLEVDSHRKDSDDQVIIISAEKSAEKDGSSWLQRITIEWNMDYQGVGEVVDSLQKLLDYDKNTK
jgi:hypothetical protein